MAQFLLLLHGNPTRWQAMSAGELQAAYRKYMGWGDKTRQKGFLVGANKLVDDMGKVVRGSKPVATDGPYSETKEVVGGYYLIEAANYEEAVQLCLDHPHLQFEGTIEVRQVEVFPPDRFVIPDHGHQGANLHQTDVSLSAPVRPARRRSVPPAQNSRSAKKLGAAGGHGNSGLRVS